MMTEEKENVSPHCCICFDGLVIPVRPICFSCTTTVDADRWCTKSCYTYLRICIRCADRYFQLDRETIKRDNVVKCLICPETIDPSTLTRNTAYEIDFLYMRCMTSRTVECPYCHMWAGDLNTELYNHLIIGCSAFLWECVCGEHYTIATAEQHIRSCAKYCYCDDCGTPVLMTQIGKHMMDTHHKTMCCSCREFVLMEAMTNHILDKCMERLVCCDICMGLIRMRFFHKHLVNHYKDSLERIHSTTITLDSEKERLANIVTLCERYNVRLDLDHNTDGDLLDSTTSAAAAAPRALPLSLESPLSDGITTTTPPPMQRNVVMHFPLPTIPSPVTSNWLNTQTGDHNNSVSSVIVDIFPALVEWDHDDDENNSDADHNDDNSDDNNNDDDNNSDETDYARSSDENRGVFYRALNDPRRQ